MAQKRFSKEQVKYTDDHGSSDEQCSKCSHYLNPTTCEIVVGRINPEGWCNKYADINPPGRQNQGNPRLPPTG